MNAAEFLQSVCLLILALWAVRLSSRLNRLRARVLQLQGVVTDHLEHHVQDASKTAVAIEAVKDQVGILLEAVRGR